MSDATMIDPAVTRVLEAYEARAQREEQLRSTLTEQQLHERVDEFLLPVGRATGTLMNLIVREAKARRILEVGSSYGYSTVWLAEAARATAGKVTSLELQPAKTEYARGQLARVQLERFVEFRVGDALVQHTELPGEGQHHCRQREHQQPQHHIRDRKRAHALSPPRVRGTYGNARPNSTSRLI